MRKEQNSDPTHNEIPKCSIVTMYHVVFMYESNITVVSRMESRIVYNNSFERQRSLSNIVLDQSMHRLLAYSRREKIMTTLLKSEDCEAW